MRKDKQMNDVINVITSLGFPIACCLCLGYYVKYLTDVLITTLQDFTGKIDDLTNMIDEYLFRK